MMFRSDSVILRPPAEIPSAFGHSVCILGLAAACAIASWFGQGYAVLPGGTMPVVDLSAGIALAGLLLGGNRLWLGVALGSVLANPHLIDNDGRAAILIVAAGMASAIQASISATLYRAVARIEMPFYSARDAGWFVVLAGLLGSLIAPALLALLHIATGSLEWDQFGNLWLRLWVSNASGVLLAAPLVLAWTTGRSLRIGPWQGPEIILLFAAPFAIATAISLTHYPIEYLYLPLLAWAAFRFGARGATVLLVTVAALAVAMTIRGLGSFVSPVSLVSLLLLDSFIITVASSTLVLLGVITQRDAAERGLADAQATLETRVRLRTQELAAVNGRLRRIADIDGLTGVANRRYFNVQLDAEWRKAESAGQRLTVILMDVDHFKAFNDSYGHPAGDKCLQSIAEALGNALQRNGELLARYGGEEFVVLMPNADGSEGVRTAERLRRNVADRAIPHCVPQGQSRVTLSAGVASMIPTPYAAPADLLARADAALYRAKGDGRDRVNED